MDLFKSLQQPLREAAEQLQDWGVLPESPAMPFFNPKNLGTLALATQVALAAQTEKRAFDVFQFIDPLIGTSEGGKFRERIFPRSVVYVFAGHVFPGATMPFGMAKAVADVNDPDEKQGGFASGDSDITGFSHMHDSGTGGVMRPPRE
jgi:putative alpha-1,2-mannosidase